MLAPPGSPNPVPRLVDLFLTDSARRIVEMHEVVARGDAAELQRLAHTQKGSAGTFGALELGAAAAELEEQAKRGSVGSVPEVMERLELAYQRTCRALEPFRNDRAVV